MRYVAVEVAPFTVPVASSTRGSASPAWTTCEQPYSQTSPGASTPLPSASPDSYVGAHSVEVTVGTPASAPVGSDSARR